MENEKIMEIHSTMNEFLSGYIPTQEIIHAASQIVKNPTQETVNEMASYLMQFDKEFISLQTVNTKSLTNNQVRLAMSAVSDLIKTHPSDKED